MNNVMNNGMNHGYFVSAGEPTHAPPAPASADRPRAVRQGEPHEYSAHFRWIVSMLPRVGLDPLTTLRDVGIDPSHLDDLGSEVPLAWCQRLWQSVVRRSGQHDIGLRLASTLDPHELGVFGQLLRSSATLANALLTAGRFVRLLSRTSELELHIHGDRSTLAYRPRYPTLCHPQMSEFAIAAIATVARGLSGHDLEPMEVRFVHAAPIDTSIHRNFFRAPVKFDQPHHGFVFPTAALQHPILGATVAHRPELERHAYELLEHTLVPPSFADRVLTLLQARLRHGEPSSVDVAAALGLHPKTLNRRLRAEGTNYQQLLNQLRHRLAEHYLSQPELSVSHVARMLGYSENSAFCRAFKRWTGSAPQDFRRTTFESTN